MALFFHSTASLVIAECACAGLIFTDVSSVICADPMYLNWATCSSTFQLIHMLADGLSLMLLTRTSLLLELIPILCIMPLFLQTLVSSWSIYSLSARRSISSAKRRLQSGCNLIDTKCQIQKVSCLIFSRLYCTRDSR